MRYSRAPSGARGLKQPHRHTDRQAVMSRPFGGAWIETLLIRGLEKNEPRRAPSGARGLKQALEGRKTK